MKHQYQSIRRRVEITPYPATVRGMKMDIKNWNRRKKNDCTNCWFAKEHFGECERRDDVNHCNFEMTSEYFHYANKDQIEALIEEAEKRHREKGGLVVCSKAKECDKNCCEHSKPHRYNVTTRQGWCENTTAECGVCIAFRGEPAKEDEVQEYVVVKDINLKSLIDSTIESILLKEYLRYVNNFDWNYPKGSIISYSTYNNFESFFIELETIGFIKKVVNDPVVKTGDCFERDGEYFAIVPVNELCTRMITVPEFKIFSNEIGPKAERRLSMYMFASNKVEDFKPVKIKITEVEEG